MDAAILPRPTRGLASSRPTPARQSKKTVVVSALGTTFTPSSLDLQADTTYLFPFAERRGRLIDGFKSMQLLRRRRRKGLCGPATSTQRLRARGITYRLGTTSRQQWHSGSTGSRSTTHRQPMSLPRSGCQNLRGLRRGPALPSGWTAQSSTIDYDYSAAPITGLQSARMAFNATAYTTFTAGDFVECYFKLKIETLPSNTAAIVALKTADDVEYPFQFPTTTSGAIQVGSATNSGSSVSTMSTGTRLSLLAIVAVGRLCDSGFLDRMEFARDPGNNFVSLALGTTGQVGRLTFQRSQSIVCCSWMISK